MSEYNKSKLNLRKDQKVKKNDVLKRCAKLMCQSDVPR